MCHCLSVQITRVLHGHSNASHFSKGSPQCKSCDSAFTISRKFKPILIGFFFCPGTAGTKQKVFAFNFFPELAHAAFYKENPLKISPDPSLSTHLHILSISSATLFQEKFSLILISLVVCLFGGNWFYFHPTILDLKAYWQATMAKPSDASPLLYLLRTASEGADGLIRFLC